MKASVSLLLSFISVMFFQNPIYSAVINVPGEQPTIQAGIDAAADGDTVLVAPGTYVENVEITKAIILQSSTDSRTTFIDGAQAARVIAVEAVSNVDIRGFTIQNGLINGDGGGIYAAYAGNLNISNNAIKSNQANGGNGGGISLVQVNGGYLNSNQVIGNTSDYGGGIELDDCDNLFLSWNWVENNTTTTGNGGGISIDDCRASTIVTNTVISNSAAYDGGGIYYYGSSLELSRNTIDNNSCGNWGGGICVYNASGDLINNLITNNSASVGGGVSYFYQSTARIINNTIAYNSAGSSNGGGIGCYDTSTSTVINTILWENTPQQVDTEAGSTVNAVYSDIQQPSDVYPGTGNINSDPLFVGGTDFHLREGSPCIDAGTSDQAPINDLDNSARPQGGGVDMGAYESSASSPCNTTGVTIRMSDNYFTPGETCACSAIVCNATDQTLVINPLFVILELFDTYYFAPDFSPYDFYLYEFQPGETSVVVLPDFQWPTGAGTVSGAIFYGALTDNYISEIFGEYDMFEFGWGL